MEDCLEDSPFFSVFLMEKRTVMVCLFAIYRDRLFTFFLRCSISLINLKEDTEMHCACSSSPCLVLKQFQIGLATVERKDDILFRLLLQLLSLPSYEGKRIHKEIWKFEEVNEGTLFHVLNTLNPMHLFHLFLAELHYNHQVLLDYLISKDTGISCAEYLLGVTSVKLGRWFSFLDLRLVACGISERCLPICGWQLRIKHGQKRVQHVKYA
ncbi:hypothetical protein SLEP1_g11945 [Rubroshorea leprosula]|nr:hypothetical protein SLEP1_g11945 [Rubroshorea leprosula]